MSCMTWPNHIILLIVKTSILNPLCHFNLHQFPQDWEILQKIYWFCFIYCIKYWNMTWMNWKIAYYLLYNERHFPTSRKDNYNRIFVYETSGSVCPKKSLVKYVIILFDVVTCYYILHRWNSPCGGALPLSHTRVVRGMK